MNTAINKIGYYSGLLAFVSTSAYVIVQLLQLFSLINSPWDEILIYGSSLCIVIPFMLQMLALHYVVTPEKQFWTHAALICSIIYAVFVTANYVVQLATVIPANLRDSGEDISLLIQTPHSLFWNFDAIGYICMGFATAFAIPVFENHGFQKKVKTVFIIHSLTTPLIAFVYFYPVFSDDLLLIGLPWGITAPLAMLMLALMFRKAFPVHQVENPHHQQLPITLAFPKD